MKKKEEDKGKLDDMATKDSVKKDDEKKEEKPDTRGMYAKIAMIKNKLRSMGQANPMVMAVDACEENLQELKPAKVREGEKAAETERTPAKDDPAFDKMRPGGSNSQYEKDGTKKKPKYNPYGKGATATPTNMAPGKP